MSFKTLPIGIDNFEKLITRGYYFVDKTLLIKDLLDNKADVNLFTRPRRFGKTLNMSMLQYFFEETKEDINRNMGYDVNKNSPDNINKTNDEDICKNNNDVNINKNNHKCINKRKNAYLFENLNIMQAGEAYTSHMGQYPVINLSLKSAKQPNFELAYISIRRRIAEEYKRHEYILENKALQHEKERYLKILMEQGEEGDYIDSLFFLCECLEKYHNKKVIILIDEYDVPLENAFFEGFYDRMIAFIRSLFESALKTNVYLEFAVITGCLRISRESIFTGLNNLNIISILNDRYAEYFGFSDDEVKQLTKYYDLEEKYELIRDWYNGYIFGQINVYNPWSVIKFIFDLLANKNVFPTSYWANTSSNSIVKSLIERADTITKKEIELLIEGKTIEKPVHEDITYDEIHDTMDILWNFMFFTGYFKKINERMDEEDNRYLELTIPNREVKYIFRTKVLRWFQDKIKAKDLSILYTAIFNKDSDTFQKELNKLLRETISFNDAYENYYHGFVVGVLANMHDHIVKSNRESGDGRSDIFIKSPSIFEPAVIMELKICKEPKDIYKVCDEALEQIEKNKYDEELKQEGYENIIKYGISFYRKDCIIKLG